MTHTFFKPRQPRFRPAFTLSEVIVAMAGTVLIMSLVLTVVVSLGKLNQRTERKMALNRDYREVARSIYDIGLKSDRFTIYKSALNPVDILNDGDDNTRRGDMLLFAFSSANDIVPTTATPNANPYRPRVARIVGIYLDRRAGEHDKLRVFDSATDKWGQSFSAEAPSEYAEQGLTTRRPDYSAMLPPKSAYGSFRVLAEVVTTSEGTDTSSDKYIPSVFEAINSNNSFLVNLNLLKSMGTSDAFEAQNSYNLILTPRN